MLRLVQYLEPSQTLLKMPANNTVEDFSPVWTTKRSAFAEGLEKGIKIAKDLSSPAEVTESTDWMAVGACLRK